MAAVALSLVTAYSSFLRLDLVAAAAGIVLCLNARFHLRSILDALVTATTGWASPSLPSSLPGPLGLPLFGYLPFVGAKPHVSLAELAQRFGGKVFRVAAGCRRFVVVSDIETVRHLAKKYANELRGKPRTFITQQMTLGAHNDLVQRWKRRRAYTDAGLKQIERNSVNDILAYEVRQLVDTLTHCADTLPRSDVRHDVSIFAARVMYTVCYGFQPDEDAMKGLHHLVKNMPDYTTMIGSLSPFDVLPFWRRLFPKRFQQFVDFNRDTANFCRRQKQTAISSITTSSDSEAEESASSLFAFFRERLLRMPSWKRKKYSITDDILYDGLEDIIRAGTESSSLLLQWFILYVAAFPEVQKRMQQEVDDHVAERAAAGTGNEYELGADDLAYLPYCRAALAETYRFCCLNPFLKRELTSDIQLEDGTRLAQGTVLLFNNWAINRDERNFHQPGRFMPERFLSEGKTGFEFDESMMDRFMPFGFGKRRCIGVDTGRTLCLLAAVSVLRRFEVRLADGQSADLEPVFGIGLAPKPYRVHLQSRLG